MFFLKIFSAFYCAKSEAYSASLFLLFKENPVLIRSVVVEMHVMCKKCKENSFFQVFPVFYSPTDVN